jgi:hypothetical protein
VELVTAYIMTLEGKDLPGKAPEGEYYAPEDRE